MADQKTEDPKSPLARRGARPFAGPAAAPSAARPFLRPATTQRATAAPFLPPVIPGRPTLGAAPQPASAPTPVASVAAPRVAPVAPNDSLMPEVEAAPARPRPITSEMVALDAFDAFDTVWGASDHHGAASEAPPTPSPLDEASLGSGVDAQQLWADDITAGAETAEMPAPAESSYPTPPTGMPPWLVDEVAPATTMPADVTTDDVSVVTAEQAAQERSSVSSVQADDITQLPWAPAEADANYSLTAWIDAAELPTADDVTPPTQEPADTLSSLGGAIDAPVEWPDAAGTQLAEQRPRFELVEEPETVGARSESTASARPAHALRIAAAFDRLAERVRGGEIDVSFIAPDAPDAAILASVLAALLGGSSSR